MPVMIADFDPGTLTGFYIILLAGVLVAFCLVCAAVMLLARNSRAARAWAKVAGVVLALAAAGVILDICLVRVLHLHVL
jgi:hypothetical protein